MKKVQIALLTLLALATALTVGCGVSSSKSSLPTYSQVPFYSSRASDSSTPLFLMNLDGSSVTPVPLTPTDGMWWPTNSADGSVIAFIDDGNLWVSNASGSTQTEVTTDNNEYSSHLSPDGKKILIGEYNPITEIDDMWIMSVDGSSSVDLTSTITGSSVWCYNGSFSADSSKVVFVCYDEDAGFSNIYTANADGTGVTAVLTENAYCSDGCDTPAFSQDGTKILFIGYSVPTSGAQPHRFIGSRIPHAKLKRRPTPKGGSPTTTSGILSMNADGTSVTIVTVGPFELKVLNSTLFYTNYNTDLSFYQIYSSNLDGTSAVSISDGTANDELGVQLD